jgi:hypothetical protein
MREFALRVGAAVVAFVLVGVVAFPVQSGPLFGIGDCAGCQSWGSALAGPNVQVGATSLTPPETAFLTGTGETFAYAQQVELFNQSVSDGFESHDALVMSWQADPTRDLSLSSWEYVYDVDPDLTGTLISLSLYAPTGVWDFSIELIDINGFVRGWFVAFPPAVNNLWQTIVLDPTLLVPQGFIPGPIQDAGFDITQVTTIRLDEAGMTSAVFPVPPAGGSLGGPNIMWNAWNHLQVIAVPEPSLSGLLVFGAALLLFRRRMNPD